MPGVILRASPMKFSRGRTPFRRPFEQTLFFWLLALTTVAYFVPYAAVTLHGLVAFLPLFGFVCLVGTAEGRFGQFLGLVTRGLVSNKALILMYSWYVVGIFLNCMIRGNSWADWRLMLGPVVDLGIMLCALGVLPRPLAARRIQVLFALAWGAQSVLSLSNILSGDIVMREVVTGGAVSEFGNQDIFAGMATVMPVMIWRAISETRVLRVVLLVCAALTITLVAISTFATPVALLAFGVGISALLSPLVASWAGSLWRRVLVAATLLAVGVAGYEATQAMPQLQPAQKRLQTAFLDPESGGYEGAERVESRWYRAEISIRSFFEDPLLGKGGGHVRYSVWVGGHSSFLDTLGAYGLLGGGGALLATVSLLAARAIRRFLRERSWGTLAGITATILLLIGGVTNPYWEGSQIVLVLLLAHPSARPRLPVRSGTGLRDRVPLRGRETQRMLNRTA